MASRSGLTKNEYLRGGEYLTAEDGSSHAILRRNGTFGLYLGSETGSDSQPLWEAPIKPQPEGDFFAIMQGDGHFCIYNGTYGGAGNKFIWGTGAFPTKENEFLAQVTPRGNFTVSKKLPDGKWRKVWAAQTLKLLTYNAHLMEDSNIVVGAWYANKKPVVFQDGSRHGYIVGKIIESGAHIVALQEIWAVGRMDQMARDLRNVYPFIARGAQGSSVVLVLDKLINTGVPDGAASSGVMLLSKFPMAPPQFRVFPNARDEEDRSASKCWLAAHVDTPLGQIAVGITHAWTDAGGEKCTNIRDLIDGTRIAGRQVMMGDFNIHRKNAAKYATLNTMMSEAGAYDSWTHVHGEGAQKESATDDEVNNNLAQFFSPMRNTGDPDCLDYIFLRGLDAVNPRVLKDWKYPAMGSPKWYWVHDGTQTYIPSATFFGPEADTWVSADSPQKQARKLCIVGRKTNDSIQVTLYDPGTKRWTHQTIHEPRSGSVPPWVDPAKEFTKVKSTGAPGVVWYGGALHLFCSLGEQIWKIDLTP
jgi:endonuclease/exonuclease/phosphatase family metal-dependent hydrolase